MRRKTAKRSLWWYFLEAVPLLILAAIFVTLLVLGYFIDSSSYSLEPPRPAAFAMKVLTWTWSNVALLSCLAALIGELLRLSQSDVQALPNPKAALARGFFIFLVALAGELIILGEIRLGLSEDYQVRQDAYFRIASSVSFLGFLVGFKPNFFLELLSGIGHKEIAGSADGKDEMKSG